MTNHVHFTAYGVPIPQGSAKAFVGKGGRAHVTADNAKTKPWRQTVSTAAREAAQEQGAGRFEGPVQVVASFYFDRPGSVSEKRRPYPTVKPDLDKLLRALLDALTDAGIWKDDSQVIFVEVNKTYISAESRLDRPGVTVAVSEVTPNGG